MYIDRGPQYIPPLIERERILNISEIVDHQFIITLNSIIQ